MPGWSVVKDSCFHLQTIGVCKELVVIVNLLVLEYNYNFFTILAFFKSAYGNFPFN